MAPFASRVRSCGKATAFAGLSCAQTSARAGVSQCAGPRPGRSRLWGGRGDWGVGPNHSGNGTCRTVADAVDG